MNRIILGVAAACAALALGLTTACNGTEPAPLPSTDVIGEVSPAPRPAASNLNEALDRALQDGGVDRKSISHPKGDNTNDGTAIVTNGKCRFGVELLTGNSYRVVFVNTTPVAAIRDANLKAVLMKHDLHGQQFITLAQTLEQLEICK